MFWKEGRAAGRAIEEEISLEAGRRIRDMLLICDRNGVESLTDGIGMEEGVDGRCRNYAQLKLSHQIWPNQNRNFEESTVAKTTSLGKPRMYFGS